MTRETRKTFGVPSVIHTDNGRDSVSKDVTRIFQQLGITVVRQNPLTSQLGYPGEGKSFTQPSNPITEN
jgi:hypothetical protein